MKTLQEIKQDMSDLYDQLKKSEVDIKTASELANIAGKFLKAEQLELARQVFEQNIPLNPAKQVVQVKGYLQNGVFVPIQE